MQHQSAFNTKRQTAADLHGSKTFKAQIKSEASLNASEGWPSLYVLKSANRRRFNLNKPESICSELICRLNCEKKVIHVLKAGNGSVML